MLRMRKAIVADALIVATRRLTTPVSTLARRK